MSGPYFSAWEMLGALGLGAATVSALWLVGRYDDWSDRRRMRRQGWL